MSGSPRIELTLRVEEARERDVGRTIVRLDTKTMSALDLRTGDIVELEGKKVTAGIAWPAYPKDQDIGILRIDARSRNNAHIDLKESVRVRKADAVKVEVVVLTPIGIAIRSDVKFEGFVKRKLLNLPLVQGDEVCVSIGISREIQFHVVKLLPKGICIVRNDTALQINTGVPNGHEQDFRLMEGELEFLKIARNIVLKLWDESQKEIRLDDAAYDEAANQKLSKILEILLEMRTPPRTMDDGSLEFATKYPRIVFRKRSDGSYWLAHLETG